LSTRNQLVSGFKRLLYGRHIRAQSIVEQTARVIVIGLGDSIFRDDGVGVHAVRRFQQLTPGPCLAVEVGRQFSKLSAMIESADRILAFDSIEAGGIPGHGLCVQAKE